MNREASPRHLTLPCHVWVQPNPGEAWQAGLPVRWDRDESGWLGEVAIVGNSGAPGLQLIPSTRLRPAPGQPPQS